MTLQFPFCHVDVAITLSHGRSSICLTFWPCLEFVSSATCMEALFLVVGFQTSVHSMHWSMPHYMHDMYCWHIIMIISLILWPPLSRESELIKVSPVNELISRQIHKAVMTIWILCWVTVACVPVVLSRPWNVAGDNTTRPVHKPMLTCKLIYRKLKFTEILRIYCQMHFWGFVVSIEDKHPGGGGVIWKDSFWRKILPANSFASPPRGRMAFF